MITEKKCIWKYQIQFCFLHIFYVFTTNILRSNICQLKKFDNMLNNDNFAINILQAFEIKTKL